MILDFDIEEPYKTIPNIPPSVALQFSVEGTQTSGCRSATYIDPPEDAIYEWSMVEFTFTDENGAVVELPIEVATILDYYHDIIEERFIEDWDDESY
jgi:hypothetical protein